MVLGKTGCIRIACTCTSAALAAVGGISLAMCDSGAASDGAPAGSL